MPYAAITYRVRQGCEDEIARIFAAFQRVDSPVIRDKQGDEAGRLLGTAVFVKDDVMVRVIHYEGDFAALARHIAPQHGVRLVEAKLTPYLVEQRDTSTPEAFAAYFRDATMRCVSQLSVDSHPARG
jgi:hypothetical protein